MKRHVAIVGLALLPGALEAVSWLDPGREAYRRGDYAQAAQLYAQAANKASPEALYNQATALYKQGQWAQALEGFERALPQADPHLQKKIYYNAGNARYRLGQTFAQENPQQTLEHWEAGLKHYAASLELDNANEDAQFNHDFLKQKLEELKQQQDQQQQDDKQDQTPQDNKDEKNKDPQEDQGPSNDSKDGDADPQAGNQQKDPQQGDSGPDKQQPQQPESKEGQQPEQKESDKEPQPAQDKEPNPSGAPPNPEPAQQGPPAPAKGAMSQAEAARILNAGAQNEKQLPLALPTGNESKRRAQSLKNW